MDSEALSHYLGEPSLREQLTGDAAEVVVGVGRDPDDARQSCIMLYVPPEFSGPLPETVTLGGKTVRVVRRERGGPLRAYTSK